MALDKKKLREIIFQILFIRDVAPFEESEIVPFFMTMLKVPKSSVKEAIQYVDTLFSYVKQVDAVIQENALEYTFDRIYRVEKNVLRLAVFEMLYDSSVSPKESIVEAIRLSKKFSSQESIKFVNAVLDAIFKKHISACSELEETKA